MSRRTDPRPLAAVLIMTTTVLVGAWVAPRAGLGQVPSDRGRDLLRTAPFDRVTLTDGTVLEVEPISPRPLPEFDADLARRVADQEKEVPREGNVLLPRQKQAAAASKQQDEERRLATEQIAELNLKPIDDPNVYTIRRPSIRSVEYFEDLLLAAGNRLIAQRDFARAFEHFLLVANRAPDWPGVQDHVDRLLYEEGSAALADGEAERGLRLLRELFERKPDYPGLLDQLGKSYGGRIERAFQEGAYPEGRRILHELAQLAPNHATTGASRALFVDQAQALADRANAGAEPAERLDLLTEALHVWPTLEGAEASYREAFAALPTLDVAVVDRPRPLGPWVRSPADARVAPLLYRPLLARGDGDEETPHEDRPGQLVANLEVTNLGRQLDLTLREGAEWSDGSGPVSALDVVRSLAERADPLSPRYSVRWERLLERAEVAGPRQVRVMLRRSSLTPEHWLHGPIRPAHAGRNGRAALPDGSRPLVGSGPFRVDGTVEGDSTFLAAPGSPAVIRRVREFPVADVAQLIKALQRGQVSLAESIPPNVVAELSGHDEIRLGRYAQPSLHMLALDGRNPALTNRTLRRAISYAIPRDLILGESLLGRPADAENRPMDGVFAADSYANAPGVEPLGHNALLARMLVAAARKEMGTGPIRLRLEYPASPVARTAVPRIVEALRAAGLEIEPLERPESQLESELRGGRRFDLAYRASRCEEPVVDVGPLICPGYDAPSQTDALASVASPRILQLLLELEQAPEFPTARGIAIQIDRESRDELPVIPLWQIVDHYAWRSRLAGPPEQTTSLYDGIERWEIEPWFARDPW